MKMRFLYFSLFFSALLFFTAKTRAQIIQGGGLLQTESRPVQSFDKITSAGPYNIFVTQGKTEALQVEADKNILPYIITEVSGNTLAIRTKKGVRLKTENEMNIKVMVKDLAGMAISGSGNIVSANTLRPSSLSLKISGSGNINLDLQASSLTMTISGSSNSELRGSCTNTAYLISGEAKIDAKKLKADNADIKISGIGKVHVNAKDHLDITVSGVGKIWYLGNPSISQKVSGMGKVERE